MTSIKNNVEPTKKVIFNNISCEEGTTWVVLHAGCDDYYMSYGMEVRI